LNIGWAGFVTTLVFSIECLVGFWYIWNIWNKGALDWE